MTAGELIPGVEKLAKAASKGKPLPRKGPISSMLKALKELGWAMLSAGCCKTTMAKRCTWQLATHADYVNCWSGALRSNRKNS